MTAPTLTLETAEEHELWRLAAVDMDPQQADIVVRAYRERCKPPPPGHLAYAPADAVSLRQLRGWAATVAGISLPDTPTEFQDSGLRAAGAHLRNGIWRELIELREGQRNERVRASARHDEYPPQHGRRPLPGISRQRLDQDPGQYDPGPGGRERTDGADPATDLRPAPTRVDTGAPGASEPVIVDGVWHERDMGNGGEWPSWCENPEGHEAEPDPDSPTGERCKHCHAWRGRPREAGHPADMAAQTCDPRRGDALQALARIERACQGAGLLGVRDDLARVKAHISAPVDGSADILGGAASLDEEMRAIASQPVDWHHEWSRERERFNTLARAILSEGWDDYLTPGEVLDLCLGRLACDHGIRGAMEFDIELLEAIDELALAAKRMRRAIVEGSLPAEEPDIREEWDSGRMLAGVSAEDLAAAMGRLVGEPDTPDTAEVRAVARRIAADPDQVQALADEVAENAERILGGTARGTLATEGPDSAGFAALRTVVESDAEWCEIQAEEAAKTCEPRCDDDGSVRLPDLVYPCPEHAHKVRREAPDAIELDCLACDGPTLHTRTLLGDWSCDGCGSHRDGAATDFAAEIAAERDNETARHWGRLAGLKRDDKPSGAPTGPGWWWLDPFGDGKMRPVLVTQHGGLLWVRPAERLDQERVQDLDGWGGPCLQGSDPDRGLAGKIRELIDRRAVSFDEYNGQESPACLRVSDVEAALEGCLQGSAPTCADGSEILEGWYYWTGTEWAWTAPDGCMQASDREWGKRVQALADELAAECDAKDALTRAVEDELGPFSDGACAVDVKRLRAALAAAKGDA